MSNKSLFCLAFFSLTLVEIGQMAMSQEHSVMINHDKFAANETLENATCLTKTTEINYPLRDIADPVTNADPLLSNVKQRLTFNNGHSLIKQLWMPAYLQ